MKSLLKTCKRLAASRQLRAAVPLLLAGTFCFFNIWLPFRSGLADVNFTRINYGSSLLAGLLNNNITWMMPLFETIFYFTLNFLTSPVLLAVILSIAGYLLVFCGGYLLRGYRAGIAALLGTGALEAVGTLPYDDEQSFYTFSLLLVLALLILKRRDNTLKNSVLCGLALGASMLVRTPLVLFPPVLVLLDWYCSRKDLRAFLPRSLALLAASYVLLLPWGFLNYSISGRFSLIDDRKAACNLITSAKGSIYTMEGDCRKLAGLGADDSASGFFAREIAAHPGQYALTVLKRLWHIFLFYPFLFGLFLIALALYRERDKALIFGMPVYFILVHSALSVEIRYFYPMTYVLLPLIIAGLWPARAGKGAPGPGGDAERIIYMSFWFYLCAVLCVEALIAAYPYRVARHINDRGYLMSVIARFPNDRVLQDMKCRMYWLKGDDDGYYNCLGSCVKKSGDATLAYFLAAQASAAPSALPVPAGRKMECLILRMLREFELGDRTAAMVSFRLAYSEFETSHNMLRGEPYQRDREIARQIRGDSDMFWDYYVYALLLMHTPQSAARVLSGLKTSIILPERLKLSLLEDVLSLGTAGERMLRKRTASDMAGLPPGDLSLSWRRDSADSKKLSDEAVKKIASGNMRAAEKILLKAADSDPANPEVFMNLCFIRLKENRREKALEACRAAAYAVYFNPENQIADLETLAGEASLTSWGILKASGRTSEAAKTLRRAAANAPRPGLPGAGGR